MKRLQLVLSNICIYWKAIKCCLWMYFQAWFFQVLSEYTALAFASSCGLKWTASVKKAKENEFESYFRCQGVRGTGFPLVRKGPRQRPPALDRWPLHNAAIHTIRAIQSFLLNLDPNLNISSQFGKKLQEYCENKLAKLRRHASRVHFAKIQFG